MCKKMSVQCPVVKEMNNKSSLLLVLFFSLSFLMLCSLLGNRLSGSRATKGVAWHPERRLRTTPHALFSIQSFVKNCLVCMLNNTKIFIAFIAWIKVRHPCIVWNKKTIRTYLVTCLSSGLLVRLFPAQHHVLLYILPDLQYKKPSAVSKF